MSIDLPQGLELIPAQAQDIFELAEIRLRSMRESLERIGRFDPDRARNRLIESYDYQSTTKIFSHGELAGFYSLVVKSEHYSLDHFYLLPECQNRGIGGIVLSRIQAIAFKHQRSIRLGALKESRSNAFYIRHGFSPVSEAEWDIYYEWHPYRQ